MKKIHAALSALTLSALALTGCTPGEQPAPSPTPASPSASTPASQAPGTTRGPGMGGSMPMDGSMGGMQGSQTPGAATQHNSTDTMFAQMMIPHHEQAVEMSEIMLAKQSGLDTRILDLANKIKASQGPEIKTMQSLLEGWGETERPRGGNGRMEGMMGQRELGALEEAQGDEAARLFLTHMIAHHQGAVTMAEREVADGQDPVAVALARKIVEDQKAEIEAMEGMLPSYQ